MSKELTITNVGPVRELRISMPEPGVYALTGYNGAGKSNVLNAIARAVGKDEINVRLRDGASSGSVSLDGTVLLSIGKVNRQTKDAEISLISTSPLSDLVEPNLKDPEAAEKARVSALLNLAEVPVNGETIALLLDDNWEAINFFHASYEGELPDDVVIVADKARRATHDLKRIYEKKAEVAQGEMIANRADKPANLIETTTEAAQESYKNAAMTLERVSAEYQARCKAESTRDELSKIKEDKPDVDAARREYETRTGDFDAAHQHELTAMAEVARLQETLAAAQARHVASVEASRAASKRAREAHEAVVSVGSAVAAWEKRQEILAQPITGANADQAIAAESALEAAKHVVAAARTSDDYRGRLLKYNEARERNETATKTAINFNALATSVTQRLGDVLNKSGIKGLSVEDGKLLFLHPDGHTEPFERLSFGQRCKIGLELASKRYPEAILPLDWRFWASLSPENRAEAARLFTESGVFVITESPSSGDLRVEKQ